MHRAQRIAASVCTRVVITQATHDTYSASLHLVGGYVISVRSFILCWWKLICLLHYQHKMWFHVTWKFLMALLPGVLSSVRTNKYASGIYCKFTGENSKTTVFFFVFLICSHILYRVRCYYSVPPKECRILYRTSLVSCGWSCCLSEGRPTGACSGSPVYGLVHAVAVRCTDWCI